MGLWMVSVLGKKDDGRDVTVTAISWAMEAASANEAAGKAMQRFAEQNPGHLMENPSPTEITQLARTYVARYPDE